MFFQKAVKQMIQYTGYFLLNYMSIKSDYMYILQKQQLQSKMYHITGTIHYQNYPTSNPLVAQYTPVIPQYRAFFLLYIHFGFLIFFCPVKLNAPMPITPSN